MDVNSHKGWIIENCLRFQENSNCSYSVDIINNGTEKKNFQVYICDYLLRNANFA